MKYAILHDNGTYYFDWMRNIGPKFGASEADAKRFKTEFDAMRELGKHYGFMGAKVVKLNA